MHSGSACLFKNDLDNEFPELSVRVVEVGASGNIDWHWKILEKRGLLNYIGFEPNEEEAKRLTKLHPD